MIALQVSGNIWTSPSQAIQGNSLLVHASRHGVAEENTFPPVCAGCSRTGLTSGKPGEVPRALRGCAPAGNTHRSRCVEGGLSRCVGISSPKEGLPTPCEGRGTHTGCTIKRADRTDPPRGSCAHEDKGPQVSGGPEVERCQAVLTQNQKARLTVLFSYVQLTTTLNPFCFFNT